MNNWKSQDSCKFIGYNEQDLQVGHSTSGILKFNHLNNKHFSYTFNFQKLRVLWTIVGVKKLRTTALDVIGSEIYKLDRRWRRCVTYSVFCITLGEQAYLLEDL